MKREDKKLLTRQRIIESAVQLFEERGYESTSIQQIADRAEVAKGTFFNYFNSKEDMILALQSDTLFSVFESRRESEEPILTRLFEAMVDYAKKYPMFKSTTRAVLQGIFASSKIGEVQRNRSAKFIQYLIPIVEKAQENGEISRDFTAEHIAIAALEAYNGALMIWSLDVDEVPFVVRMSTIFKMFIEGIRAKVPLPSENRIENVDAITAGIGS